MPESVRSLLAVGVGLVVTVLAVLLAAEPLGLDETTAPVAGGLLVWVVLSTVYCVLTCVAFSGRSGEDLAQALERAYPRDRKALLTWFLGGGSAAWSVQFAVIALLVGLVLAQGVAWFASPVMTGLGIGVVVASWVTVLVSYSVHYALRDQVAGPAAGFAFHGDERRAFGDYVYLAAGVSTTFSVADVEVLDTTTRRMVTTHTIVAFAFSAVIVALVVVALVNA